MNLNMEKEASSWLTVLPLQEHCFALYKQVFRDALALKYGWQHFKMPAHCSCSQPFSVQHALSCPKGGFPSIRHNDLRDINAAYLSETYHGVAVEHSLIYSCYNLSPIRSLCMPQLTHSYGARLDIFADGFWSGSFKRAFHVRVFKVPLPSQTATPLSRQLTGIIRTSRNDTEKRIRKVEHSSFTPLVFCSLNPAACSFYKRFASMLAEKWKQLYSFTLRWLWCRHSFNLLHSSIMCLWGARSSAHRFESHLAAAVDLTVSGSNLLL